MKDLVSFNPLDALIKDWIQKGDKVLFSFMGVRVHQEELCCLGYNTLEIGNGGQAIVDWWRSCVRDVMRVSLRIHARTSTYQSDQSCR